tara:strand:- start:93 stop:1019 length:927 start_codon:yes stop_codon:yes gene_type:complete
MEKLSKTLRKCLELLKGQFEANIMFKATIDTVISVKSEPENIENIISEKSDKWQSSLFGFNPDWLRDFVKETDTFIYFLMGSVYTTVFTRVDSLVANIFSLEFQLKSNKSLENFLFNDYLAELILEKNNPDFKSRHFNETLFKYNYLLKPPQSIYGYEPLINRIDTKDTFFKDSYEKAEALKDFMDTAYKLGELPSLVYGWHKYHAEQVAYNFFEAELPEIINLEETVKWFNTDARKLRNDIVHTDHKVFEPVDLFDEDLLYICNVAEFIQYALIWNLAMHSYPDMIDLFDSKWSIDHLERRYIYEEH